LGSFQISTPQGALFFLFFFLSFFGETGLNSGLQACKAGHFTLVILGMGSLFARTADWPQTLIFLISVSQVAKVTGVTTSTWPSLFWPPLDVHLCFCHVHKATMNPTDVTALLR
jgi:hypothetical protein